MEEDGAAENSHQTIETNFKLVTYMCSFFNRLITTKCECGLFQKIGPASFNIPKNVLDLVNSQALLW